MKDTKGSKQESRYEIKQERKQESMARKLPIK